MAANSFGWVLWFKRKYLVHVSGCFVKFLVIFGYTWVKIGLVRLLEIGNLEDFRLF